MSFNTCSIGNSLFTITIVSIVFNSMDCHSKLLGVGTKIKLNGRRMYMLVHPMHFSKISGLRQHSDIFLLVQYKTGTRTYRKVQPLS